MRKVISLFAAIALVATAVAAIAGIGSAASGRVAGTKLNLVAYSTPREAYGKLIRPARTSTSRSPTARPVSRRER